MLKGDDRTPGTVLLVGFQNVSDTIHVEMHMWDHNLSQKRCMRCTQSKQRCKCNGTNDCVQIDTHDLMVDEKGRLIGFKFHIPREREVHVQIYNNTIYNHGLCVEGNQYLAFQIWWQTNGETIGCYCDSNFRLDTKGSTGLILYNDKM